MIEIKSKSALMVKNGVVKKTNLKEYSRPRKGGIIGINLRAKDSLIGNRLQYLAAK